MWKFDDAEITGQTLEQRRRRVLPAVSYSFIICMNDNRRHFRSDRRQFRPRGHSSWLIRGQDDVNLNQWDVTRFWLPQTTAEQYDRQTDSFHSYKLLRDRWHIHIKDAGGYGGCCLLGYDAVQSGSRLYLDDGGSRTHCYVGMLVPVCTA